MKYFIKNLHRAAFAAALTLIFAVFGTLTSVNAQINGGCRPVSREMPLYEDFNTLAATGTGTLAANLPTGFGFAETGTAANTTYNTGDGTSATADTYSFGSAGSTDRSFGSLSGNSLTSVFGGCFINNSGFSISDVVITLRQKQWRRGDSTNEVYAFSSSSNATSLTSGTYIPLPNNSTALDLKQITAAPLNSALDGNYADNRSDKIANITFQGLIPNGGTFYVRWVDVNNSGSDNAYAIDDFTITVKRVSTAATVEVGGRVLDSRGRGISKARVTVSDNDGGARVVITNGFGYFSLDGIEAGETYVYSVSAKGYQFAQSSQALSVNDNYEGISFNALSSDFPFTRGK